MKSVSLVTPKGLFVALVEWILTSVLFACGQVKAYAKSHDINIDYSDKDEKPPKDFFMCFWYNE